MAIRSHRCKPLTFGFFHVGLPLPEVPYFIGRDTLQAVSDTDRMAPAKLAIPLEIERYELFTIVAVDRVAHSHFLSLISLTAFSAAILSCTSCPSLR